MKQTNYDMKCILVYCSIYLKICVESAFVFSANTFLRCFCFVNRMRL